MKNLIYVAIILFSLTSCSKKLEMKSLANSNWMLKTWTGHTLPLDNTPKLMFDKASNFSGKSFCNSYGGNLILTEASIKFDKIFSTKMFCQDVSDLENRYISDLSGVDFAKIENGQLSLYKNQVVVMTFVQPL